jgi:hypothetical protein
MPKKRFSAEQIVVLLRQIEVLMSQGKAAPMSLPDPSRHFAATQQFGRCWCIADSGKPSARQIYGFTA